MTISPHAARLQAELDSVNSRHWRVARTLKSGIPFSADTTEHRRIGVKDMAICALCESTFPAKRADARFCSLKCRKTASRAAVHRKGGHVTHNRKGHALVTDNGLERPDDGLRWVDRWATSIAPLVERGASCPTHRGEVKIL